MKTLYVLILSAFLACISISNLYAQSPGGVVGPAFWIKSDDAGTIATAWKDNSANANHIPNIGVMTLSPADRAHNFHPYTTGYTGAKYFYNQTSVMNTLGNVELPNTNTSIFSAVRPTAANGTGRITGIDDDTNAAEPGISIAAGKPRQYEFFNTTTSTDFSIAFNTGVSNIFSAIANNTVANGGTSAIAGGEKRLGLNGSYETFSGFAAANKFQMYGSNLKVGHGAWDAGGPFPGDIMEVIWYKRTLTDNEQSRVNTYLALKNGVTLNENYLATNGSVVWDRTNNTNYNSNIFGIARDNSTALHQKQSGSVNSGQQLVISTTGFANNNAANSTGLVNDLQYLMIGDNGLKQKLNTPLAYAGGANGATNFRFESIWKTHNTGSVGTVTVAWPKGVNNLYLVQSTDAVFDATDTFTAMATEVTINGVVYNTTNVTLGNGQFFTFAGFAFAPGGVAAPGFWVKSDDAGNIATAWKDQSLNADNIPNIGAITLSPANRAHNFNPYTTGYSASKFFYNDNSVLNTTNVFTDPSMRSSVSVFTAVRPTAANGTGRITGIDDDTNGSEPGVSINSGMPHLYKYYGNGAAQPNFNTMSAANAFTTNKSSVFSAIQDQALNSGRGQRRLGLDGSYEDFDLGATTNTFNVLGKHLRIGDAGWESAGPFPGEIMEVVWYKRALTANEQSRINTYLAIKNGTTLKENYLATNSSVVWNRTANINYNSNIFGIARDNITALHQKQSGSVNDAQKLVISTIGFANNNAANNTAITNDFQYLIVGDNGLKQALSIPLAYTAGTNGVTNFRFESIWKTQNTGSVGTVTLAWPKGVANLYLVQSTDAIFDATDTFTAMATEVTINGVVYNTTNVTLANGQFFTFAGFGNAPGGVSNGLSYWYRADKNATNTGANTDVTGWTDVWNGTTVAKLGANTLPKYVLGASNYFNFNPGINFTVGTQTLGNNTVRTLTSLDYDVFTLTKEGLASGGSNPRVFSTGMDNTTTGSINWDGFGIWPATTDLERRPYGGTTQFPNVAPAFSTTIPSIMYFRNTNTSTRKGLNGDLMATAVPYNAVGSMFGGHIFGNTLFSSNGSDNAGFVGHIGETIVYGAGTLLDTERRRVDSYLAIKYGITLGEVATEHYLDTDGNIVWNGASNAAYNNNIFGVSRDDIEMLAQKVSKSVNTGTILTVATINNFVNPNQEAARTAFVNDKTYFLLGDNNVTATPVVDITVAGTTWKRIQRTWLSQRKNTPNALYFQADLSSYGINFGAGSTVWMLVADDSSFTVNVKSVAGTYSSGKWVFSNNFNTENVQRYITFAGLPPSYCVTGDCNPNTFLNTSNPNTIEYDNMVSTFHSTLMRDATTGKLMVWGERMANDGAVNLLVPTEMNGTNYPNLTGNVLKFTGGSHSMNVVQSAVLTTTGLFAWGQEGVLIANNLTSNTTFQKISVGTFGVNGGATKTDGLPDGVTPADVKMLFGTYNTLALTTCSGEAWVLSLENNLYGDNATSSAANDMLWHRVHTNATTTLDNVVAVRGTGWRTLMALTATGEVYTWGSGTRLGDGSASATRVFATQMTLPVGVTPKMIGVTGSNNVGPTTYYILGTNGNVYALGENRNRELGNFSTTDSNVWVQGQKSATAGDYLINVVWISPNEHDYRSYGNSNDEMVGSINVLTADGRLWAWGANDGIMLGGSTSPMNPTEMPGSIPSTDPYDIGKLNWTDKVIAVETGGHTSMIIKDNSKRYGYVGHRINGSMGDGTSATANENQYNFAGTPEINLCGAPAGPSCTNPGLFDSAGSPSTTGISDLKGFTSGAAAWPANVPNGHVVIESKNKGFVIPRVKKATDVLNPVEGMLVYDIEAACIKLYNGLVWKCLAKDCN
ncbi:MAG: hypothetical protein EOP54_05885 [Sphingobacteriales bacterium]|nr:MAG: hypothetical protein EOP54_05885 [Sphingobacteriales bacterium]